MLRFFVLSLLLCTATLGAQAQLARDTVSVKKVFGGVKFEQHGAVLSPKYVQQLIQPVPEAYQEMKKARANNTVANIVSGAGGFLLGYTLGTALSGAEAEWTVAAIGGGLIIASIPFSVKFRKQATHAVQLYNAHLSGQQETGSLHMRFGLTGAGVGLRLELR